MTKNIAAKGKHNKLSRTATILTVLLLFSFVFNSEASYSQTIDFQIRPTLLEIQAKPDSQLTYTYNASGTKNTIYYIENKSFKPKGETGNLEVFENDAEFLDWITYTPSKITFKETGEIKTFEMKIDIPDYAEIKDYTFVTIMASEKTEENNSNALLSGEIQAPVLLSVEDYKNPAKRKGEINQFSTPFIWFGTPIDFILKIKNTGNLRFKSNGHVEIENLIIPNKTETINLLPQNILANSIRQIDNDIDNLEKGKPPTVKWKTSTLLGIFRAKTIVKYPSKSSSNELILESHPIIFVVVHRFLVAIFLILTILLMFIYRYKHKHKKKKS